MPLLFRTNTQAANDAGNFSASSQQNFKCCLANVGNAVDHMALRLDFSTGSLASRQKWMKFRAPLPLEPLSND
jgi:hypothetical protein